MTDTKKVPEGGWWTHKPQRPTDKTVQLQDHLHEAAGLLSERLVEVCGREAEEFLMGGGSILAARYGHRKSTDIDLWATERLRDVLFPIGSTGEETRRGIEGRIRWGEGEIGPVIVSPMLERVTGTILDTRRGRTRFSIYTTRTMGFSEEAKSGEKVSGTVFAGQDDEEILEGKIRRTGKGLDSVTIRDIYDLCVMAKIKPEAFRRAAGNAGQGTRERAGKFLKFSPADLHWHDPKPLLDPQWEVDLDGLAQKMSEAVRTAEPSLVPGCARKGEKDQATHRSGRGYGE